LQGECKTAGATDCEQRRFLLLQILSIVYIMCKKNRWRHSTLSIIRTVCYIKVKLQACIATQYIIASILLLPIKAQPAVDHLPSIHQLDLSQPCARGYHTRVKLENESQINFKHKPLQVFPLIYFVHNSYLIILNIIYMWLQQKQLGTTQQTN